MRKILCFIGLLSIWGCQESNNKSEADRKKDSINKEVQQTARDIAGNFSDQSTLRFSSSRIDSFFIKYDTLRSFQNDLKQFYTIRHYAFAWYTDSGLTEQASHLYVRLENLPEEGLNVALPYKRTLDSLINIGNTQSIDQKSETELLLTSLYFFFAQKVWGGMEESATQQVDWLMPRKKLS